MRNKLKDLGGYLLVLGLAIFLSTQVFFSYQVNGSSMYPTLQENERGIALRTNFFKQIKRFDIVVINYDGRYLVKRVIGLPGETIKYRNNKLYINNNLVLEDFLDDTYTGDIEETLGVDEYFCLGDNRQSSADSRVYGAFMKESIKAIMFRWK